MVKPPLLSSSIVLSYQGARSIRAAGVGVASVMRGCCDATLASNSFVAAFQTSSEGYPAYMEVDFHH